MSSLVAISRLPPRVNEGVSVRDVWGSISLTPYRFQPEALTRARDGTPEAEYALMEFILRSRAPLVVPLLLAEPVDAVEVEVDANDEDALWMFGAPLSDHTKGLLAEKSAHEGAAHVRALVEGAKHVSGPLIGVARLGEVSKISVLDGLHRLSAWRGHHQRGEAYPVRVTVVRTKKPLGFGLE